MKIININARQGNPFYNPYTANNGGGYDQPVTVSEWSNGWKVVVDDSSCGDFGCRWSITVSDANGDEVGSVYFNGMDGDDYPVVRFASGRDWGTVEDDLRTTHTFRLLVVWGLDRLGSRFRAELRRIGDTYTVRCR